MSEQQVQIKFDEATIKGVYTNNLIISHTAEEFVLDFINVFPPQGSLVSRVITSPGHAKRILKALEDNIKKYEAAFGNITASEVSDQQIGFKAS